MSVVLVHLGTDQPEHLRDCIEQIRLWSDVKIYLICYGVCSQLPFFKKLNVEMIYTCNLRKSEAHQKFLENYSGNLTFRNNYWRHVFERFFWIDNFLHKTDLTDILYLEYDVLMYYDPKIILDKLSKSHQTIRFVRSEEERAHPATIYFPNKSQSKLLADFLGGYKGADDMVALKEFADAATVHYLPCLPECCVERGSPVGFLGEEQKYLDVVFDSLVVGQYVTGVDVRNTGGVKMSGYVQEKAYYKFNDIPFSWKQDEKDRWFPVFGGVRLATIHVHSKATKCFMSCVKDEPTDNYCPLLLLKKLQPN